MVHTGKTSVFLCAFVAFAAVMPVAAVDDHPSSQASEKPAAVHPVHMTGQRVGHGHQYSHSYGPIDPHPVHKAYHHHHHHHHPHHHSHFHHLPHHHHHHHHHLHHHPHHHYLHHNHLPVHGYIHRKKGKGRHHHKGKKVHGYHYIYGHHPHHWRHGAHLPAATRVHKWHAWVLSNPLGQSTQQSLSVPKGTAIGDHQPLHNLANDGPKKVLDSAPRAVGRSWVEREVVERSDWEDLEDLN